MLKIQLPLNNLVRSEDFDQFSNNYYQSVNKHPLKNTKCVYKLSFADGTFYIGRSRNLAGRIWNHCTLPVKKGNLPTLKDERMRRAIAKKEKVVFEILSNEPDEERKFIEASFNDKRCLNMKPH